MKMPFVPWTQVPVPRNLVICVNFKGKQIENISPNYFSWSITEKCKTSVNCDDIEDNAVVVCGLYSGSLPFSFDFLTENFWGRSTRRPSWSWKKKIITKRKEKRIIKNKVTRNLEEYVFCSFCMSFQSARDQQSDSPKHAGGYFHCLRPKYPIYSINWVDSSISGNRTPFRWILRNKINNWQQVSLE